MNIKLKSLTLENYKKFIGQETFRFYDRTMISGKNKEGKSTLENAYMEILTGKEVDGTQPDGIRPCGTDSKDLNRADVIREVTLDIDGKETTIRKITKQKWRKPHGQTEEVLDGNTVSYEIDGFTYAPKKFEEYMKELADPEIMLMCSNPNPFLSILDNSTVKARELLERLSGFSLEEFLSSKPQYSIISALAKGHSVEETIGELNKQLNRQKKELTKKDTELKYEQTRDSGVQIETSDLELAKGEWREKIAEIDRQEQALDEAVKAYDTANSEILSLKSKLNEIANNAGAGLREQRANLDQKILELNIQNKGYANDLRMAEMDLTHSRNEKKRHFDERERLLAEWEKEKEKVFCFDSYYVCELSGQICEFIRNKNEKAKEKAKESFDNKKKKRINEIEKLGTKESEYLNIAKNAEKEAEQKIKEIREQILSISSEIEKLCGELDKLPKEVDLSGNTEYQELSKQIKKKEFALSTMDNGSEKRMELRQQRNQCMDEISKLDAQIQKANADAEQKERKLAKLKEEFDNKKQAVADIERNIDILNQFSIEKNAALAEKINPYFRHFKFNFLNYTKKEHNPVETCEIVCDGISYKDLNNGDRKLSEVDLCRGLQEMNGLNFPIWIDESVVVDPDRIPVDMEQQLILISRTDDKLSVTEM